jgi:hypothetical protein
VILHCGATFCKHSLKHAAHRLITDG